MRNYAEWRRFSLATVGAVALAVLLVLGPLTAVVWSQATTQSAGVPQWQIAAGGKMAFDVASVKQNNSDGTSPANRTRANFALNPSNTQPYTGGRLSVTRFPLNTFIAFAYKLGFGQQQALLAELPKWAVTERFDIEAETPETNPTKDQFRLMMQSLLADRFRLRVHTETRQAPVFALELAKAGKVGTRLKPHSDDPPCYTGPLPGQLGLSAADAQKVFAAMCGEAGAGPGSAPGRLEWSSRKVNMSQIGDFLCVIGRLDREVVDRTGVGGFYDFTLDFAPELPGIPSPDFQPDPDALTFQEALQEQLGLKLVPTTAPVDVLVIDHVEEPSPN